MPLSRKKQQHEEMPTQQQTHRRPPPLGLEQRVAEEIATVEIEPSEIAMFTSHKCPDIGDFIWFAFIAAEHRKVAIQLHGSSKRSSPLLSPGTQTSRSYKPGEHGHVTSPMRTGGMARRLSRSLSPHGSAQVNSPGLAAPRTRVATRVL